MKKSVMKKSLTYIGLTLLFLILDNSLMPFIAYKGYRASLLFIYAISFSLIYGEWTGLWLGVVCGYLQDIYFFHGFGINMLTNMLLCVVVGRFGRIIFKEKYLVPIFVCGLASIAKGLLVFVLLYVIDIGMWFQGIFYYGLYNLLVCSFMYPMLYKITQKQYMQKEWKF